MNKLSTTLNQEGIINLYKRWTKDDFFKAAQKQYDTFKAKIDGVELNSGYGYWWMMLRSFMTLVFLYGLVKVGAISQVGSIFKSLKSEKKNAKKKAADSDPDDSDSDDKEWGTYLDARERGKEARKKEEPVKKSKKKNNSKKERTPEEEEEVRTTEESEQSFFGKLFGRKSPTPTPTTTSSTKAKEKTPKEPRRGTRNRTKIDPYNADTMGGGRKTKSNKNKIRKTKKNYKRRNKKRVK